MAITSNRLTSSPGSYVDGQNGQDGRGAKKRFVFPTEPTQVTFPTDPQYTGRFYSVARSISLVVTDVTADPNYFDVDFEFEVQSTVRGLTGVCVARGHLFETDPAINPNQQAVSDFEFSWSLECGIHLVKKRLRIRAVRFPAAQRANVAWFYFVADSAGQDACPGTLP